MGDIAPAPLPQNIPSLEGAHHHPLAQDSMTQGGFTDPGSKASTFSPGNLTTMRHAPDDDGMSIASSVRSDFPQEDVVLELPSLQDVANGESEFECPYCRIVQNFKHERQWRSVEVLVIACKHGIMKADPSTWGF
jgi:hypothetical protein